MVPSSSRGRQVFRIGCRGRLAPSPRWPMAPRSPFSCQVWFLTHRRRTPSLIMVFFSLEETGELFHKQPDHVLHPEKWTKYSLEDVEENPQAERQSALHFLQDLRKRKEAERSSEEAESRIEQSSQQLGKVLLVDEVDKAEEARRRGHTLNEHGTIRILEPVDVGGPRQPLKLQRQTRDGKPREIPDVAKIQLSHLHISTDGDDSEFTHGPNSPEKRLKLTDDDTTGSAIPRKPITRKTPRRIRKPAADTLLGDDDGQHPPEPPQQQAPSSPPALATFSHEVGDDSMDADSSSQNPVL